MGMGFQCVLADPPWPESGGGKIKRGADRHYPLMETEEIIGGFPMASICNNNAHLWMWVTNNYLREGLRAMDTWGFRYVTNFVWVKVTEGGEVRGGLGQYSRGAHELLLFGVRGKLPANEGAKYADKLTVELCRRGEHSAKPERFYEKIEAISPGPRLELFARDVRPGWWAIGNTEGVEDPGYIYTQDASSAVMNLAHNIEFLKGLWGK